VLQRAKDTHASQQLTCNRAVRTLLNEFLDGDDLEGHPQSHVQACKEKWEDGNKFANSTLDDDSTETSVTGQYAM